MSDPHPPAGEPLESLVTEATDAFMDRVHRGERPDVEEYARRYPPIAGILRRLLPAVRLMGPPGSGPAWLAPPPPEAAEALGRLGDFQLVREIGRGGMGVVYEAEQVSLGRCVALKVLPLAAALDPRQLQRFRLEAQAAAHLHHAHIVPIHSVGCERGTYYYAMQYVEGRSLAEVIAQLRQDNGAELGGRQVLPPTVELPAAADRLARGPGVPPGTAEQTADEHRLATVQSVRNAAYFQTVAALGIQAAEALEYAHTMGVVHRDVKPANLLLDGQGNIYVTDFGLAQLQGDPGLTLTGDLVGTLRYMSPEQAQARRGVLDHRTDIYSLGATLYELLTLAPAYDAPDRHALLQQIAEAEPVPPRQRNTGLPADLETIVLKAMAKEPERRYASAKALADDLKRFQEHRPILARRPTALERAGKWSRRHRRVVAAAVALLLLAVVGFAVSTALIAREQWRTKAAHDRLAEEEARTRAAYEAEAAQRARAEASFRQARQVLDFFTEVSEEELADKPELQGLRRRLLEEALKYYRDFIEQCPDAPVLQAQLAASHLRVAAILDEIGSKAEALTSLELARKLQENLVRNRPNAPELQSGLLSIYHRFGLLRGGRELDLLAQKSVQQDLKLSEDQGKEVARFRDNRREAFRESRSLSPEEWRAKFEELAAQEAALGTLLNPEQAVRLRQIALQQRGIEAFADPEVAKVLRLTQEQKERIWALTDETRRLTGGGVRPGDFRPEEGKRIAEAWRNAHDRILNVLTDEQKARWKELTGEPFKGKLRSHHRGGFGQRHGPWGPKGP
jgi:serine/threonine protein kinase